MVQKKVIVISLGGSLIIPDKINYDYIEKFKKTVRKFYGKYKLVVVCGGGAIARAYINALKEEGRSKNEMSLAGIRATRMNALFMMQFFGKEANNVLPRDMKEVQGMLSRHDIVFCGSLRYVPNITSDSVAADLAHFFKTSFVNLTDVKGLYTKNPKKFKDAKFIPEISWKDFENTAREIKYHSGQHFVLDQHASTLIRKNKTKTAIIGEDLKQLENFLSGKKFIGTIIEG